MNWNDTLALLTAYRTPLLTLHVLSMAIGLGGATVSDVLFFRFLKDYKVSKKEEEVLHVLKNLILTVMFIITLSGAMLYLPESARFNASPMFLVKAIAAAVLLVNGIALHIFIAPYLMLLNLREHGKMGRNWHRLAFALGSISICSWYSVFLIAMLKTELPWGFATMLAVYLSLLTSAVVCSQIVEYILTKRAMR